MRFPVFIVSALAFMAGNAIAAPAPAAQASDVPICLPICAGPLADCQEGWVRTV